MFGIELAGGALVFALFIIVFTLAVIHGLYTRTGSGIAQRPYKHVYGGAPGAARESRMSGSADRDIRGWSRGTR
ncbi:MAG TPA: hypothetical protein VHF89_11240 [Solirubrobacteraceae bacterium]|nr:hypothetical protein [Solirubrobacteraceae bacterium]